MPRIYSYEILPTADALLGPLTVLDNQLSPVSLISVGPTSSNKFTQIQYSLDRGGIEQTGRLMLTTDGVDVTLSDEEVSISFSGITFYGAINSGNLILQYTSTNTGINGSFKYFIKTWS